MSSNNAKQTNDNQAQLANQQQQTQNQIIAAESANDQVINADLGTGRNVPQPTSMPSITAVMGPSESSILSGLNAGSFASSESEAAAAVDPNETGLLNTFMQSAHGAEGDLQAQTYALSSSVGTESSSAEQILAASSAGSAASSAAAEQLLASSSAASQAALAGDVGTTANPLGTQISAVPAYTVGTSSDSTSSSSGGVSPLLLGLLVVGGAGGLYAFRKHL